MLPLFFLSLTVSPLVSKSLINLPLYRTYRPFGLVLYEYQFFCKFIHQNYVIWGETKPFIFKVCDTGKYRVIFVAENSLFHKWIIGKCFDLEQEPHAILLLPCKHLVVWRLFLLKKNWRGKNPLKYASLLCNQKLSWNSTSRDNVLSKLALSAELTTAVDLNFYNSVHHVFVRALCGLKKFKLQIKLASELKIPFMNHFSEKIIKTHGLCCCWKCLNIQPGRPVPACSGQLQCCSSWPGPELFPVALRLQSKDPGI